MLRASAPVRSRALGPGFRRSPRTLALLAVAGVALGAAGCGSGTEPPAASANPTFPAARQSAAVKAQQEAIHRQVQAGLQDQAAKDVPYGKVPSYLPPPVAPDAHVVGTPTKPAFAIQGNPVVVRIDGGEASALLVGPDVPNSVIGTSATHTSARFDLTFTNVHGTLPISDERLWASDHLGRVHRVRLSVAGHPAPGRVSDGPVTVHLAADLPEGEGQLHYQPAGRQPAAVWDYIVETD